MLPSAVQKSIHVVSRTMIEGRACSSSRRRRRRSSSRSRSSATSAALRGACNAGRATPAGYDGSLPTLATTAGEVMLGTVSYRPNTRSSAAATASTVASLGVAAAGSYADVGLDGAATFQSSFPQLQLSVTPQSVGQPRHEPLHLDSRKAPEFSSGGDLRLPRRTCIRRRVSVSPTPSGRQSLVSRIGYDCGVVLSRPRRGQGGIG